MMPAIDVKPPSDPNARARPLDRALGKIPIVPKAIGAVAAVWARLVSAFCDMIDPVFARFAGDVRLVGVVTDAGGIDVHQCDKDGDIALGALAALDAETKARLARKKSNAIELRLRPDQVLVRTLSLPGVSRDYLKPIIENRLERLTPWRADKVLYGYCVVAGTPDAQGAVAVSLLAASKDVVEGFAARMAEAGLAPTRIGAGGGGIGQPMPVTLDMQGGAPAHAVSRPMVSRVALVLFGALAVVFAVTASIASRAVDDEEAIDTKLVKARVLLKGAITSNAGDRERALLDAKVPGKATFVLIDRLATAIPDDTYLKELAITPDKVRLVGSSGNPPALVGKLEAAGLANVRFNAAVTREKDLRDSFEMTADRVAEKGSR